MYQAGLFSAVTSAFIVQVDSQLRPDPGDETAALLRVLIYKIDNTTFGHDVPTLPQWAGPPATMVHVQAILFASLAVSLFSAFLAMLGKQWLNRYTSTDMRGSAIERSRNRQRKLDGIVTWYFDYVMESLPLMLQIALLLLGCALSRYFWETSVTIAFVILGATLFGLLFSLFIVAAGAATKSCPYQTPGSPILRYLWQRGFSALGNISQGSWVTTLVTRVWDSRPSSSGRETVYCLASLTLVVPLGFILDVLRFGRAVILAFFALPIGAYHFVHRVRTWFRHVHPPPERGLGLRCISWTLRTSLDRLVRLSTLEYLIKIAEFTNLDPTLVTECFNIFVGCVSVNNHRVVIIEGSEQLATLSIGCFFRAFNLLSVTNPTSSVLTDLRRHYDRVFPSQLDLVGLPFRSTLTVIHAMASPLGSPRHVQWRGHRPSDQEHVPLAQHMAEAAQAHQQTLRGKVPRWILRFALDSLSLDPPPPPSVVANCLTVIAIDLGCSVPHTATLNDKYVQIR